MDLYEGRGRRCNSRAILAGAAAALCAIQVAHAADVTANWLAAVSDNWTVSSRWSSGTIPNNGVDNYLVTLGVTGATYIVTLDAPATIKDLSITSADAILDLTTNNMTVNRDFTCTSGRLWATNRGPLFSVAGTTRLNGATTEWVRMLSTGTLIFEGAGTNDICDTEIDHEGSIMSWTGNGTIQMDAGTIAGRIINGTSSTFTVTGDGTMSQTTGPQSVFENRGIMIKNGGTGVTLINGPTLDNTGTVDVRTGTLRVTNSVQYDVPNQKLTGGKWLISDNATLDFLTQTITKNGGEVTLNGANSVFTQINGLTENSLGGKFTVTGTRLFTTAGAFTNNGTVVVGTGSEFRLAAGAGLTNGAGSTFDLAGKLRYDGAAITSLQTSKVILRSGGQIVDQFNSNALAGLNEIKSGGLFQTVGFNYTFASALTLGSGGTLAIGAVGVGNSSNVTVTALNYGLGSTLNIINGRLITTGSITQRGTLSGNGTVQGNVVSQGEIAPGASPGTLTIEGNLQIDPDSIYRCELLSSASGNFDVINIVGDLAFGPGAGSGVFDLTLLSGFHATLGEQFDVMNFRNRAGLGFGNIVGLNTVDYGFAAEFTDTTFRLTVIRVPAPGAIAAFGLAGLFAGRRRRRI